MAYKTGECFVCEETTAVQSHHLLPLEYGGPKDGPQIKLCSSCHLVCHYEAEIFYKTGDYGALDERFPDAGQYKRAEKVIHYIIKQRMKFEAEGKPAEDARRRVSFQVSHEELLLLHAAKRVQGFKSLERFAKAAITAVLTEMRKAGRI